MLNFVKKYAPVDWSEETCELQLHSSESRKVQDEINHVIGSKRPIRRLTKVQNLHFFGQFLIREQLLLHDSMSNLFRVRGYISVPQKHKDEAIMYNLDPRRCNVNLYFNTLSCDVAYLDMLVIVEVLSTNRNAGQVTPSRSSDYYIKYIVEF